MLLGSYFFGIIGTLVRWLLHFLYCKTTNKKVKSFKKIWIGDKNDPESGASIEMLNNILGIVIVVIVGILLMNVKL